MSQVWRTLGVSRVLASCGHGLIQTERKKLEKKSGRKRCNRGMLFAISVLDRANCAMPLRLCRAETVPPLSLHEADEAVVQVLLPLVLESVHQEVDVDPLAANGRRPCCGAPPRPHSSAGRGR